VKVKTAVVLHDYATADEGFLSLSAGTVMVVTDEGTEGWWTGYEEGNPEASGLFPSTYVELVAASADGDADGASLDVADESAAEQAEDAAMAGESAAAEASVAGSEETTADTDDKASVALPDDVVAPSSDSTRTGSTGLASEQTEQLEALLESVSVSDAQKHVADAIVVPDAYDDTLWRMKRAEDLLQLWPALDTIPQDSTLRVIVNYQHSSEGDRFLRTYLLLGRYKLELQ
jgi:hypothetical protein